MIRVVRGSSLLLVSAIVAACAAHRDEHQATADVQGPQTQPVTQEVVAAAPKEEERKLADFVFFSISGYRHLATQFAVHLHDDLNIVLFERG